MFPWLWIFAPLTYWPLSGAVSQDFSLDAFFRAIGPASGAPSVEQRAFEQASYGRQLGWLTDVIVEAVKPTALSSLEASQSFASLEDLHAKIKLMKAEHRRDQAKAAIALLDRMAAEDPDELARLLQRYGRDRTPLPG
jgi:hypothetical protein